MSDYAARLLESLRLRADRVVARFDDWINPVTGMGTSRDKTTYGYVDRSRLLTDDELSALYHFDDMAARMVDVVPQEMLREPFDVETGDAKTDTAVAEKFEALGVRGKLAEGVRWGRCYGGGALILGADDGREAHEPLNLNAVRDLTFLYAVDRRLLWPVTYYTDPEDPRVGEPETYSVTTINGMASSTSVIHESRLVIFRGAPTGARERLALASWDLSVLQRAFDVLRQFNTGWKAVETLMTDGNQTVFKMSGLAQAINAPDGMRLLQERIKVMDMYRSFVRAIVIDADGKEDMQRQAPNFAGIPDVLEKFMLRLAAAVQIPVTILMGQSPAGLNATGDNDFRWFYDRIRAEQNTMLAPKIRRIADVWLYSQSGPWWRQDRTARKPVNVKFASLWAETPLALAQREQAIATRDKLYVDAEVLLPEEVALQRFRPEGFANEIQLEGPAVAARKAALAHEQARLTRGQVPDKDPNPNSAPEGGAPPADQERQGPALDGGQIKGQLAAAGIRPDDEAIDDGDLLEKLDASEAVRMFTLERREDDTGVSGTGDVAKGILFEDGSCVIRWRGQNASWTIFESMNKLLGVHGHGGKTVVRFSDDGSTRSA